MEGVGSRAGRASSRYGPTSTTTFTGPVRKWKKQWVHVSSQTTTNRDDATSPLRLHRWTPVATTQASVADDGSFTAEEPPRRKFRYTPIIDLEERKREDTGKVDGNSKLGKVLPLAAKTISQSDDTVENFQGAYKEIQHSNIGLLHLELGSNSSDEDSESEAEEDVPVLLKRV